jgi:hypothetical protein
MPSASPSSSFQSSQTTSFRTTTTSSVSDLVRGTSLVDNPLWFGITLLSVVLMTAAGVVFIRRQATKFRERWTCDVSVSICFRLLVDVGLYRRTGETNECGGYSCNNRSQSFDSTGTLLSVTWARVSNRIRSSLPGKMHFFA